jgi:2-polyprenyl-3-methyl-5-hydroxy-6-metoxy-1,4-benzoquinol methylase
LASKGMDVTAVDNLAAYINEVNKEAKEANVKVNTVQANVLDFVSTEKYDLVMCMGNSLNFFDAADTEKLFSNISSCLNTGGHLLINSWSIAEIAFKSFKEKSWSTIGDIKFLTDSKILFQPTRMETESIIIAPDGTTEVKMAIDYIFSINEMNAMLTTAGFLLKEIYSIPGRKKFTVGEPRAYIVAEKK